MKPRESDCDQNKKLKTCLDGPDGPDSLTGTNELNALSELRTDRVRFEWHPVDDGRGLQRRFQL